MCFFEWRCIPNLILFRKVSLDSEYLYVSLSLFALQLSLVSENFVALRIYVNLCALQKYFIVSWNSSHPESVPFPLNLIALRISSLFVEFRCTPSLSLVRKLSLRSESVSVSLSLFALRISYRFFEFVCTPTLFIFYNFISLRISCFFI